MLIVPGLDSKKSLSQLVEHTEEENKGTEHDDDERRGDRVGICGIEGHGPLTDVTDGSTYP